MRRNTTKTENAHTEAERILGRRQRMLNWLRASQGLPRFTNAPTDERRRRLLEDLNHAVAQAPDDMPIREVIRSLNQHGDD